ncbi:phospholipase A-2-activating protein [Topomyia yanbarensis]|uniref:phospholipase A-2-activating protein n=1 Tax=Topomyia yanbarensis TaxID=2498891 RepID=UPI00273CA2DA|nr:phospholipase A-2-activating protein [Topomyia yanbarensis]XP_058818007.1 phospholipase A-2-activating protein [Topomyia yanbarensis]XP_058818008.1 phospholipase A-2-activating protein [Topomyia yanbarensis]
MIKIDDFKLSCELAGHKLDVRAVAEGKGYIVSGSRDKTAKVWTLQDKHYSETATLVHHTNYVGAVLVIEENGWICTASNDATICVYKYPSAMEPFVVLKGHTSTVCALAKGNSSNVLISGSWDKSAKIWTNVGSSQASVTLVGHEAAVWAVARLSSGKYVTGSADKSIFVWNETGERLVVLKGHKDCVRGLLALPGNGFLSCANDAVIRHWNDSYECVKEFHGHTNYIYSISRSDFWGDDVFITSGEDGTIRMWSLKLGPLGNELQLPAQSVWSVAALRNGDIVAGSSDAMVRVFTTCEDRAAPQDMQEAFKLAVEVKINESTKQLGGMKVNDLPGPESLLSEGRDGQTRIVRHADGKIMCYQWSNNKWELVGDVMGATGGDTGKQLYEGREYDFVFSVNLSDEAPNLKLPYNRGEDPWFVAQRFIHKHSLPQAYLEQVANFIIQNSSNVPVQPTAASKTYDPFTGGSRYVPGMESSHRPTAANTDPLTGGSSYTTQTPNVGFARNGSGPGSSGNADPFTGGSSYTTGVTESKKVNVHFPHGHFVTIENADLAKVLVKLKELNSKIENKSLQMSDDTLDDIVRYVSQVTTVSEQNSACLTALKYLYTWPTESIFPVLDITRLVVRDPQACQELFEGEFMNSLLQHINHIPANQMMGARCFVNMISHSTGRNIVLEQIRPIVEKLSPIKTGSANLQIALASFYLNLSMTQLDKPSLDFCKVFSEAVAEFLDWVNDYEAIYRGYQALGNLLSTQPGTLVANQLRANNGLIDKILVSISAEVSGYAKLNECASYLYELLA